MSEGFEGLFPNGSWTVFDNDGSTNGEYYWDDDDYMPRSGAWSAWTANGGANALDPQSYYYPNYAQSWMVYGPFDLTSATDAELLFYYWNQSELNYDWFGWYASVNGSNFYGTRVSGDSGGWQYVNFDLTNVPTLGNLTGQSSVWVAFVFTSDGSNVDDGPFVDDVVLQGYVSTQPNLTPYTPSGWDYPIVPSSQTGTHTVNTLYANQSTFIDWAVINTGANIATTFRSCLYFDGNPIQCWNTNGLNQYYYAYIEDWLLNLTPTVGSHTLRITSDVDNVIAESNEGDNSWEWTFTWISSSSCGPYTSAVEQVALPIDGKWLSRNFVLSDAPANATISKLFIKYNLTDKDPGQIHVELVHEKTGRVVSLTSRGRTESGRLSANLALDEFKDAPAAGIWTLRFRDASSDHPGNLLSWAVRASYQEATLALKASGTGTMGNPATWRISPDAPKSSRRSADKDAPKTRTASPALNALGWSDVVFEDFEGAFPNGLWSVSDLSNDGCEFLWDDDDYRYASGGWAAWPANGGANGLDPATSKYPPNMFSWMIYGPFDLSDASDAKATFKLWLQTETNYDPVFFGVSSDGVNFNGYNYSGTSDWVTKEINFASYAGDSSVWAAFVFSSDSTINMEGPWVDDVRLEKYTGFIIGDCTNEYSTSVLTSAQLFAAYDAANRNTTAAPPPSRPDSYEISLMSRRFTPAPGVDAAMIKATNTPEAQNSVHVLVQLNDWPTPEQKEMLSKRGLRLLHYVPSRTWIAVAKPSTLAALASESLIRWAGPLTTTDRTSQLLSDPATRKLITNDTTKAMSLIVEFASDVDLASARRVVTAHGGKVVKEISSIGALMVILPGGRLTELANEDSIIWIEPPLPKFDPLNDCVRQRMGVNNLQSAPYNLNGSGVDILVYDAGTVEHPTFSGRLTVGDNSGVADHSTHVAGTAAGNGTSSPLLRDLKGMAPSARVISYGFQDPGNEWLYNDPGDIESDWRTAKNTYGADIGTASIGTNVAANGFPCEWEGNYGAVSELIDGIVRGSLGEPYIATWAAGNERGNGRCGTGYGTTAPPGNAKNPIHVGATYSDSDIITVFSSFGPSDDGRIKPTISAPGCEQGGEGGIRSTIPDRFIDEVPPFGEDDYDYPYDLMCGTSMATPAVAGVIADMIQQYRLTYSTSDEPLPSTIKALLIQTAVDRGNAGPDYQYGYGRVDGVSAMDALIAGDFKEETMMTSGEVHEYSYAFSGSIPALRVSLAWDDAPATPSALTQLVNDLDLRVISPSGQTYYPFVLDPANPGQAATTGDDARNNQEQVFVTNPPAGTWKIRARAYAVPTAPQRYSIVFSGARYAPLTKTPPPPAAPGNLSAAAASQTQINLSWTDNSNNEEGFRIERSLDGVTGWTEISTATGTTFANSGLSCGTAYYYRVRAYNAGGNSAYSNIANATTFACTPTPNSPADAAILARTDSVLLTWNSLGSGTQYYAEFWGGPSVNLNSGWVSGTSWSLGSQWGGTYQWRVKAKNASGESAWSETRSLTIKYGSATNMNATGVSASQINLSWSASADAPSNIDGYRIYRDGTAINTVGASATSYNDTGLPNCETTYNYVVKAYKGSAESDPASASANTGTCPHPDLIVESITYSPGTPVAGQPVNYTVRIKNQGTAATGSWFWVNLYLDHVPTGCSDFSTPGTFWSVDGLAANTSQDLTYSGLSMTAGAHQLHAFVDSGCSNAEANEGNNIKGATAITIAKATTTATLASAANPSVFGQPVTFTATVTVAAPGSGTPTGSVSFKEGATTLGTGTLSGGVATFTTSSLARGSHSITAAYDGDTDFNVSASSVLAQVVDRASTGTALNSAPNPSVFGESVMFTATVTTVAPGAGITSGTITFKDGATVLNSVTLAGGVATYVISSLAPGSHGITAQYVGNANFTGSTSPVTTQVVNQATTSVLAAASPNPSVLGQMVAFTATVSVVAPGSGVPSGNVTFKDGGTTLGSRTLSGGTTSFSTGSLAVGAHSITVLYNGSTEYATSTSPSLTQTIGKASTVTTIESSPNPSLLGQSVTFTATVAVNPPAAGTPTGSVTFKDGSVILGTGTLSGGKATFSTSSLLEGSHVITAVYGGDVSWDGSTSVATTQSVMKASSTSVVSSANPSVFGQSVILTATVSAVAPGTGTPTGMVTFKDGASVLGTAGLSGGQAVFSTSTLAVAHHPITAAYGGDSGFNGSSSVELTQIVEKAVTRVNVESSANPSLYGQSVVLTGRVSVLTPGGGSPSGTVTFKNGTTTLGTGTLTGNAATLTVSSLGAGSHAITALYAGDSNMAGSSSAELSQVVGQANTSLGIASSGSPSVIGQSVTFTATLTIVPPGSGLASGTVTFKDGSTSLATKTLVGNRATFVTATLGLGAHSISAEYAGNSNLVGSTSTVIGHNVNPASTTTTLTAWPNPALIRQTITLTATVAVVAPGGGTPGGSVTFKEGATVLGTRPLASGKATLMVTALGRGTHAITAVYEGDANHSGSTSIVLNEIVNEPVYLPFVRR